MLRQSAKSHSSKPPSYTHDDLLSLDVSRGPSLQQRGSDPVRLSTEHKLLQAAKSQDALAPSLQDAQRLGEQGLALRTSRSRPFLKKAIVVERKLHIEVGDPALAPEQSFCTPTASTGFKRRSQLAAEKKAPFTPVAADSALFRPPGLRKAPSLPTDAEEQAPSGSKPHQKLKIITGSSHSRRDAKASSSLYKITTSSFNKTSKSSLQSASKDQHSASRARGEGSGTSAGRKESADRPQVTPFSRKLAHLQPEHTPTKPKPVRSSEPCLFDSASKYQSRFLSSIKRVLPCNSLKDCGRPLFGPLGPASATFYKDRIHEHHTREVERKIADRRIRILQSSLAQLEKDSERLAREDPLSAASTAKKAQL